MELDAIQRDDEESDEEYDEENEGEVDEVLFFMEPNHDKIRAREDLETQEYWEAGITAETINVLKQGNMDHAQKTCYHCNRQGHIKANCPARKKLYVKPWTKKLVSCEKRTTAHRGFRMGRGQGKAIPKRSDPYRKRFTGSAQAIQPSEEDF